MVDREAAPPAPRGDQFAGGSWAGLKAKLRALTSLTASASAPVDIEGAEDFPWRAAPAPNAQPVQDLARAVLEEGLAEEGFTQRLAGPQPEESKTGGVYLNKPSSSSSFAVQLHTQHAHSCTRFNKCRFNPKQGVVVSLQACCRSWATSRSTAARIRSTRAACARSSRSTGSPRTRASHAPQPTPL